MFMCQVTRYRLYFSVWWMCGMVCKYRTQKLLHSRTPKSILTAMVPETQFVGAWVQYYSKELYNVVQPIKKLLQRYIAIIICYLVKIILKPHNIIKWILPIWLFLTQIVYIIVAYTMHGGTIILYIKINSM